MPFQTLNNYGAGRTQGVEMVFYPHNNSPIIIQFIMPRCTVHRRHTVVRSCVGFSVCQILHIFVSDEFQVLKVGQYAKNDILAR